MKKIMAALVALLAFASMAFAGTFPEKPVQLVVPFKPGGGSDISARIVAKYASGYFPEKFIVTNISGGQSRTGQIHVQKARPDGYTLFWQHQILHMLYATGTSRTEWDVFEPVAAVAEASNCVVVPSSSRFKAMADLVAFMKSHPGKIRYGVSPNVNSHFAYLAIAADTDIEGMVIPMNGDKNRIIAMLGGNMDASTVTISAAAPYLKSGDLRMLGVMAGERNSLYPEYPTLPELGIDGVANFNYVAFAPKGTPVERLDALALAFKKAMADPECIAELGKSWVSPRFMDRQATIEMLDRDSKEYLKLAKEYGLSSK